MGSREAAPQLLEGLRRLSVAIYDSAGIATVAAQGLTCLRAKGRLRSLTACLKPRAPLGNAALATPAGLPMANQKSAMPIAPQQRWSGGGGAEESLRATGLEGAVGGFRGGVPV